MQSTKKIDLTVEIDVLTGGIIAEIVNAILEALLFQRNQIPFVYKTYQYYVNKWKDPKDTQSNPKCKDVDIQNFQMQRKKHQAIKTEAAIGSMRQVIKNAFGRKSIKCLRFLFGPTIYTAKEAYTVHVPTENIVLNHFYEHHKIAPNKLNQTLLSLLTSEELYPIFSNNLKPTNIYLELEILETGNLDFMRCKSALQSPEIFPKDFSSLPASCKDVHIYLVQKQSQPTNDELLTCCKQMQVFEDLLNLSLDCNTEMSRSFANENSKQNLVPIQSIWWEAEICIRGFKDQPIKGANIWT